MGVYNSCKFPSNFHSYNDFYISALNNEGNCPLLRRCSVCSLSISTCFQETGPYPFSGRHPLFLVLTFFPALELFALETHFTIRFFLFSSSPISRNLHSFQVCPSLQKIFILSLSWFFIHCHGEDGQRTSLTCGRVLLIVSGTDVLLMVFPTLSEGSPSVQTSLSCTLPQIKCLKPTWPQSSSAFIINCMICILLLEQAGSGTLESLLWTLRLKRTFHGCAILETESQSHKQAPHV